MKNNSKIYMSYKIQETVELGYDNKNSCKIGGTTKLSVILKASPSFQNDDILKKLDCFDHCTISRSAKIKNYSRRYFYVKESNDYDNIFLDIAICMYHLFKDIDSIDIDSFEILLGKEQVRMDFKSLKSIYKDFKIEAHHDN